MSEVGLVPFARVALEVSREVVPAYSHRFSPQRFTQPQLLAILCLMRYEDWTFRAAEVRLAEHRELKRALELQAVPDYSTLFRFMLRVEEQVIAQVLAEVVRRFQSRRPAPGKSGTAWRRSHAVALLAQMALGCRYPFASDPGAKGPPRTDQ